jgi:hypothetical protein
VNERPTTLTARINVTATTKSTFTPLKKRKPSMKTLITIAFCGLATCGISSAQQPREKPEEIEALGQYVGDWTSDVTSRPADWTPKETRFRTQNHAEFVLDGWFLRHIEISRQIGTDKVGKSLFVWTFDPKSKRYVGWSFQSTGIISHVRGTWDAGTRTFTHRNVENPPNTTSQLTEEFSDEDNINGALAFTGNDGRKMFDMVWTRKRQEHPAQPLQNEWANIGTPDNPIPDETKRLDPFVGEWDAEFIHRPSEASPQGRTSQGSMTARWILDGRFLHGTTEVGNHRSEWVIGYDTNRKEYRYVRFTDAGQIDESTGQWNDETGSLVWTLVNPPQGHTRTSTTRFVGTDGTYSHILAKNRNGTVQMDLTIKGARRQ